MRKGREERDEKKKFLQRGEKGFKKNKKYQSVKEKQLTEPEESPTLLLDVNLG